MADGDAVFSPRLAGFVLDAFAARPDAPVADPELDQLTNREREVLRLLARGYAYKEIAKELFISIKTVETHVSNVLRKLQMSNRYELSRWAAGPPPRLTLLIPGASPQGLTRDQFVSHNAPSPSRVRVVSRPRGTATHAGPPGAGPPLGRGARN